MKPQRRIELGSYLVGKAEVGTTSKFNVLKNELTKAAKDHLAPMVLTYARILGVSFDANRLDFVDSVIKGVDSVLTAGRRFAGNTGGNHSFYNALVRSSAHSGVYHPVYQEVFNFINYSRDNFKILLHGKPGTGKTSLSHILENAGMKVNFVKTIKDIARDDYCVQVIDDVDLLVPNQREGDAQEKTNLRNLLAFLDKNRRVILTTNTPENLDPAITRGGRIDHVFEIGYLRKEDIEKVIALRFIAMCGPIKLKNNEDQLLYNEFLEEFVAWALTKLSPEEDGLFSPCKVPKVIEKCASKCRRAYIESILGVEDLDVDFVKSLDSYYDVRRPPIYNVLSTIEDVFDAYMINIRPYVFLLSSANKEEEDDDDDEPVKFQF